MSSTQSLGLLSLMGCLVMLGAWLQWRRAPTVEWREKRTEFYTSLCMSAAFAGFFGLGAIFPPPVPPSLALSIGAPLCFLVGVGFVLNELRLTMRARNADS